jgi:hypothetical protein
MALDGVSWVRGGLVETALAARGLAVPQNRRRPLRVEDLALPKSVESRNLSVKKAVVRLCIGAKQN